MEKIDIGKLGVVKLEYWDRPHHTYDTFSSNKAVKELAEKLNEVIEEIETLKQIKIIVTKDK